MILRPGERVTASNTPDSARKGTKPAYTDTHTRSWMALSNCLICLVEAGKLAPERVSTVFNPSSCNRREVERAQLAPSTGLWGPLNWLNFLFMRLCNNVENERSSQTRDSGRDKSVRN